MLNDYEQKREIGRGSFSTVVSAVHKITGEMVAVKKIKLEIFDKYKGRILAELDIIRKLKHENVLKFYEIYQSKNHIYILSELCDGTLTKLINKTMSEQQIFDIYKQIMNGIKYLYDNKIFHRDIKPENILIKDNIIKIADFGFAKEIKNYNNLMDTICGSPLYMAPEIVLNKPYNSKSDIWSLGIILYFMMYKKHPYGEVKSILHLLENYKSKTKILCPKQDFSYDLINLTSQMLIYEPNDRISWENLFDHNWLNRKIPISIIDQSMSTDIVFDDNILFESQNSVKSNAGESYNDSCNDSRNDSCNDSRNDSHNDSHNGSDVKKSDNDINDKIKSMIQINRTEPIKINKKYNKLDLISSKSPQYNIPRAESLKIQIADKEININEDHFGDSYVQILNTQNLPNECILNDDSNKNDSDANLSYPWTFIKKSMKFFSL